MTIIVGAIGRSGRTIPDSLRRSLIENLSRHAGDRPEIAQGENWMLAKVDVGALQSRGFVAETAGGALVVAGEPLARSSDHNVFPNRQEECERLFQDLRVRSDKMLRTSTGAFCGGYYSATEHRLTLFTDKLGVRPIYYVVTPEFAAFASALRILEAANLNKCGIDLRGTYETCAFGFPLGTRTCYEGVRTIGPAEVVHIGADSEQHDHYLRWHVLERHDRDEASLLEDLSAAFSSAVARRLRGDKTVLSFLSGGLDSRTIIAALRSRGVDVVTVNFSPPATQDRVFAAMAAAALGTRHHQLEVTSTAAKDAYRQAQLQQWVQSLPDENIAVDRPQCIWSGDGGSVALGHVYLDQHAVDAFERGDAEGGIRAFVRYNRINGASNGAMTRRFREQSSDWHLAGIRQEITNFDGRIDGRLLHLFLMLNDQRRHMAKHFENIDVHRFEFHLPFFDSDFLSVVLRSPVQRFLRHSLYHKWLARVAPVALTVPWQTYPNHEKCPIAIDPSLRYQWDGNLDKNEDRALTRQLGRSAMRALLTGHFPSHLIDRLGFAAAIASCLAGASTYNHVASVGETFARCWQRSQR